MIDELTDMELWEFIAKFAGWTELHVPDHPQLRLVGRSPASTAEGKPFHSLVPDYINSVDAFIRDVVPLLSKNRELEKQWYFILDEQLCDGVKYTTNATAKERCLALYRALDGKLPEGGK